MDIWTVPSVNKEGLRRKKKPSEQTFTTIPQALTKGEWKTKMATEKREKCYTKYNRLEPIVKKKIRKITKPKQVSILRRRTNR